MNTRHLLSTLALAAASAALPFFAAAQVDQNAPNSADRQFIRQAMLANAKEIKSADAERYSKNPSVRLFARTMIRDHGVAVAQLAALANQLNVPYPRGGVVNVHTSGGDPSSAARGPHVYPDVDSPRAYMQDEIADHKQAIALYETELKNGNDRYLEAYAAKTLPQLKTHLAMAQRYMTVGRI
jgi:putative membrane protein